MSKVNLFAVPSVASQITLALISLAASACAYDPERTVPTMVRSPWGTDEPLICYAQARNFRGLVPIPCNEIEEVKP